MLAMRLSVSLNRPCRADRRDFAALIGCLFALTGIVARGLYAQLRAYM